MALTQPSKSPANPIKQYRRVRFIGDRDLQDFEVNEVQQIQDEERHNLANQIFIDGIIVAEAGGTIGQAQQGVKVANVVALSSGIYSGFDTKIYTLKVVTGGGAGVAVIKITTDGEDGGPERAGYTFTIDEDDTLDGTMLYAVGTQGVQVAFNDAKVIKNFIVADSWTILVTAGRRPPVVNVGASSIMPPTVAVYVEGNIVLVPSATLVYPALASGTSVVYCEIIRDIITGDSDQDIRAAFTNTVGAERERIIGSYKTTDTSSDALPPTALWRRVVPAYLWNRATNKVARAASRPIAFRLGDIPGQLSAASLADIDFGEQLKGVLAEIVEDITGAPFRIDGLRARLSTNAPPMNQTLITIEAGKARISGLRIVKDAEEDIPVDLATEFATVLDEAKTFATGTNVYSLNKATGLSRFPIKQITGVTAIVEVTRQLTKGTANGLDPLPDTPVQAIIDIPGYTVTTDFVQNGNFVDWSPGGTEPTTSTSYDVTYRYTKQMVPTTDYLLIDSDSDGDLDSIDFSPAGDNPVDTTVFFVDYEYYLPRIDLIFLRTDNVLEVLRGTAAEAPVAPRQPTQFLGICEVHLGPNSNTNIRIVDLENYRVTMPTIRDAIRRQEELRRNDTLQSLLNQTKLRETAAFKAIFADAFASDEMTDLAFDRLGGAGGAAPGVQVKHHSLLDLFEFELTLPIDKTTHALVKNDSLIPVGQTASQVNRDFITLPYSEVLEINQPQYSEETNINPFLAFAGPGPSIVLTPDHDDGIVELINTELVDTWIARRGKLRRPLNEVQVERRMRRPRWVRHRSVVELRRIVDDRAALYMRSIQITVSGYRFAANEDDIGIQFDGKVASLTPIAPTVAGSLGGTVKADAAGYWKATFVLPANVRIGTRNAVANGAGGSSATAVFTGDLIERRITIFERAIFNKPFIDPLAQTFAFSQPTAITRVDIPFASKAAVADVALNCELRDVELPGGFPGRLISELVVKQWSAIQTGHMSHNQFVFGNPMFIPRDTYRSLVLITDSASYRVYTATGGQMGQDPVMAITVNPNIRGTEPAGILLESLNALNWEPRSSSAMRYFLYRAEFAPESWVYFDRISSVEYSQILIGADEVIPEGTEAAWQVSIDGLSIASPTKVWLNVNPHSMFDFGQIATTIDIRVKLSSTSARISPYINFNNWFVEGYLYEAAGKYISIMNPTTQDITQIKIYVEANVPSGAVNWFASNGEDSNARPVWEAVSTVAANVDLGDGFFEKTLTLTFDNGIVEKQSFRKIRVRADLTTANKALTPRVAALAASFI
jgi:hypothetical protein